MSLDSYEPPDVTGSVTTGVATGNSAASAQFSYGAGADAGTMNMMMMVVVLGYTVLLAVMMTACICGPRMQGFIRFDPESSVPKPAFVKDMEKQWRNAFIAKVYSILAIQLFMTVSICFAMMQFGGRDLMIWTMTEGSWTYGMSFISLFVLIFALMCNSRKHPINLILLACFTLAMSYTIGLTCTAYAAAGKSSLVLEAFAITSIIFVGLTIFTVQSKIDFSFLGMGLGAALLGLFVWGMFAFLIFPSYVFSQIYALAGAIIFSLYIVYDTWNITQSLSYDDYVIGAINLYLDFINLFLFILRLLTGGEQR